MPIFTTWICSYKTCSRSERIFQSNRKSFNWNCKNKYNSRSIIVNIEILCDWIINNGDLDGYIDLIREWTVKDLIDNVNSIPPFPQIILLINVEWCQKTLIILKPCCLYQLYITRHLKIRYREKHDEIKGFSKCNQQDKEWQF